jgi:hypothetical protein
MFLIHRELFVDYVSQFLSPGEQMNAFLLSLTGNGSIILSCPCIAPLGANMTHRPFNSRFPRKFKCFATPLIGDGPTIPPVSCICSKRFLERSNASKSVKQ